MAGDGFRDRERFAADLSKALQQMGEVPKVDLHEGGILHKGWGLGGSGATHPLNRATPASKDDQEIVRECIAGDSGSLSHYDHALAQDLSEELRSLIIEQRVSVQDQLIYLEGRATRHRNQTA